MKLVVCLSERGSEVKKLHLLPSLAPWPVCRSGRTSANGGLARRLVTAEKRSVARAFPNRPMGGTGRGCVGGAWMCCIEGGQVREMIG